MLAAAARAAEWEFGPGIGAGDAPAYPGADQRDRLLAPFPYFRYVGRRLTVRRNEVRWWLGGRRRAWLDLAFSGGLPVRSRGRRAGMPPVPWHLEIGPRLNLLLAGAPDEGAGVRLAWREALDAHGRDRGWVVVPELWWDAPHLLLRLGASYASRRFLDAFYGVPPAFARPGRPAFAPARGWRMLHASAWLRLRRGNVRLWAGATLYDLAPFPVSASPLVASSLSVAWGVGVAWSWWSSPRAPAAASARR